MPVSTFGRSRISRSLACGALAAAAIFSARRACALDATWTASGAGNWVDGVNWSTNPLVPDSAGDTALFPTPTAAPVINIDASITVGAMTFDSQKSYTLSSAAGTGSLALSTTSGPASITVTTSLTAGLVNINVPVNFFPISSSRTTL
jgi:hypothetical protein